MIIILDNGHGKYFSSVNADDSGAVGPGGTFESNVTDSVALDLKKELESKLTGVQVYLTSEPWVFEETYNMATDLQERVALAESLGADLFISLHCNSDDTHTATYISTWIYDTGGQSEKLANLVQKSMCQSMSWEKYGLEDGGVRTAPFYVVRKTTMPSILCEMGFISNPKEEADMRDPAVRNRLALAIARSVYDYIGIAPGPAFTLKVRGQVVSPDHVTVEGGITMVRVREIAEILGLKVTYNASTNTAEIL